MGMACILDFRDDHGIDCMENLPQISENETQIEHSPRFKCAEY